MIGERKDLSSSKLHSDQSLERKERGNKKSACLSRVHFCANTDTHWVSECQLIECTQEEEKKSTAKWYWVTTMMLSICEWVVSLSLSLLFHMYICLLQRWHSHDQVAAMKHNMMCKTCHPSGECIPLWWLDEHKLSMQKERRKKRQERHPLKWKDKGWQMNNEYKRQMQWNRRSSARLQSHRFNVKYMSVKLKSS